MNETIENYRELMNYTMCQLENFCEAYTAMLKFKTELGEGLWHRERIFVDALEQTLEVEILAPGFKECNNLLAGSRRCKDVRKLFTREDADCVIQEVMCKCIDRKDVAIKKWLALKEERKKDIEMKLSPCQTGMDMPYPTDEAECTCNETY